MQLGLETFRVKATGLTHRAEWAWVYDFHEGKIIRILAIEDLSASRTSSRKQRHKALAHIEAEGVRSLSR